MRKIFSVATLLSFLLYNIPTAIAGQAVILSDAELDQVYAQGLNFNFDSFLGSKGDAVSNLNGQGFANNSSGGGSIFISPNKNVQILSNNPALSSISKPQTPAEVSAKNSQSSVLSPELNSIVESGNAGNPNGVLNSPLTTADNVNNISNLAQNEAPGASNSAFNQIGQITHVENSVSQAALNSPAAPFEQIQNLQNFNGQAPAIDTLQGSPASGLLNSTELTNASAQLSGMNNLVSNPAETAQHLNAGLGQGLDNLAVVNQPLDSGLNPESIAQAAQAPLPAVIQPNPNANFNALNESPAIIELASLNNNNPLFEPAGLNSGTPVNLEQPQSNAALQPTPQNNIPVQQNQPTASSAPQPIQLDIFANPNGDVSLAVTTPQNSVSTSANVPTPNTDNLLGNSSGSSGSAFNFTSPNNGGLNIVDVAGSSQQNLSALVNINAAGSIVPVMINLTVVINSNVTSLSSLNDLNLSNYSTFQLR